MATLGVKFPFPPQYLTMVQIVQFITGIAGTSYVQVMGSECASPASRLVLTVIQTYAVGLIVLFAQFFKKKYSKKK